MENKWYILLQEILNTTTQQRFRLKKKYTITYDDHLTLQFAFEKLEQFARENNIPFENQERGLL